MDGWKAIHPSIPPLIFVWAAAIAFWMNWVDRLVGWRAAGKMEKAANECANQPVNEWLKRESIGLWEWTVRLVDDGHRCSSCMDGGNSLFFLLALPHWSYHFFSIFTCCRSSIHQNSKPISGGGKLVGTFLAHLTAQKQSDDGWRKGRGKGRLMIVWRRKNSEKKINQWEIMNEWIWIIGLTIQWIRMWNIWLQRKGMFGGWHISILDIGIGTLWVVYVPPMISQSGVNNSIPFEIRNHFYFFFFFFFQPLLSQC